MYAFQSQYIKMFESVVSYSDHEESDMTKRLFSSLSAHCESTTSVKVVAHLRGAVRYDFYHMLSR